MENLAQHDDIRQKVMDYKDVINGFMALLNEENRALEAFESDRVAELFEQKSKSVAAYRSYVAYFIKNQQALNEVEEEYKVQLKEMSMQLDALLQDNDRLLRTRMETSKSIMDSIVSAAKKSSNANSTSYGSQGKYSPLENSKNAIAVNRTL